MVKMNCQVCGKETERKSSAQKYCKECVDVKYKEVMRKRRQTPKAKEAERKRRNTPERKEAERKRRQTPERKEKMRKRGQIRYFVKGTNIKPSDLSSEEKDVINSLYEAKAAIRETKKEQKT